MLGTAAWLGRWQGKHGSVVTTGTTHDCRRGQPGRVDLCVRAAGTVGVDAPLSLDKSGCRRGTQRKLPSLLFLVV
jgi:hypothetical protein